MEALKQHLPVSGINAPPKLPVPKRTRDKVSPTEGAFLDAKRVLTEEDERRIEALFTDEDELMCNIEK